jgi:hypothetical protein
MLRFVVLYADQNERDNKNLASAIRRGRVEGVPD